MEFNNYEIISALSTLKRLSGNKFPQKISYAITRNIKLFDAEYREYQEQLQKILTDYKDYIIEDEDGNPKMTPEGLPLVSDDKMQNYVSDINDLLSCTSDIAIFHVAPEAFNYDDDRFDCITPNDIMLLQEIMCKREE